MQKKSVVVGILALCPLVLLTRCSMDPGDAGAASSSGGGSSSSGVVTGAPLNGQGQTLVGGSRLKVQYVLGADGSKQLLGFRDTQLNFGCSFLPTTGGGTACIPMGSVLGAYFNTVFPRGAIAIYYADDACTRGVSLGQAGAALDYVVHMDSLLQGSFVVSHVFHAVPLAASDGGTVPVFSRVSGSCTPAATSLGGNVYTDGEELPLASLAQGQVQVEP